MQSFTSYIGACTLPTLLGPMLRPTFVLLDPSKLFREFFCEGPQVIILSKSAPHELTWFLHFESRALSPKPPTLRHNHINQASPWAFLATMATAHGPKPTSASSMMLTRTSQGVAESYRFRVRTCLLRDGRLLALGHKYNIDSS